MNALFRTLGAAMLTAVVSLAASASERTYTYVGDAPTVHYNTYQKGTFDLAIHVNNPTLAGKKVTRIRARVNSMTQQVENCSLWLSSELKIESVNGKKLNAPDICTLPAVPDADGWMEVTLEEPYVLTGKGVFAGYSFTSPSYDEEARGPIMYSQSRHAGGFWYYSRLLATRWMDYESTLKGVLPIYVTVEGEFGEYEVSPLEWDTADPLAETGSDFSLPLRVYNTGDRAVSSLDISFSCGDYSGTARVDLPEPLPSCITDPYVVNVPFPASSLEGRQTLALDIENADGHKNTSAFRQTSLPVDFRPFVPVQRTLLEEASGTWCSACPRGWMAIEALKKLYPGRFLAVAYHGGKDPMKTASTVPFEIPHFPSAVLDRGEVIDPFYGADKSQTDKFAIQKLVDAALRTPAKAGIAVTAQWADEARTGVAARAEVRFTEQADPAGCKVAFILTADGLKGDNPLWWQVNSANGGDPDQLGPVLGPLATMGNPIRDMTYDHVALIAGPGNAVAVDASLAPMQAQELTCTFDIAEAVSDYEVTKGESLVQNPDKLHVLALLLDAQGKVMNAAETAVSAYAGISMPAAGSEVTATEYYDLYGRRIAFPAPASGLIIKVVRRADGSASASKIMR